MLKMVQSFHPLQYHTCHTFNIRDKVLNILFKYLINIAINKKIGFTAAENTGKISLPSFPSIFPRLDLHGHQVNLNSKKQTILYKLKEYIEVKN